MNDLERLKKLVLEGGYDADSRKEILELESRLQEVAIAENIRQYPTIQKYLSYLKDTADRCTALLTYDRKLTDIERQVLFEKRDICEKFTSLFNGSEKASIEETIKHYLDVASSN
jgi:hypothetical protein